MDLSAFKKQKLEYNQRRHLQECYRNGNNISMEHFSKYTKNNLQHQYHPNDSINFSNLHQSHHLHQHQQQLQHHKQHYTQYFDNTSHCSYNNKNNNQQQPPYPRDNIIATMERFEPSNTAPETRASHHHNSYQDYSYAYYEPGAALRHSNIPYPAYLFDPGPSKNPPANSLRALLSVANRSKNRNMMYTRKYADIRQSMNSIPQENIYEEIIHEDVELMSSGTSLISLNQNDIVEDEFRQVQNRHRRVLGELNLSVEAMLMPSTAINEDDDLDGDDKLDNMSTIYKTASPCNVLIGNNDIDSGFSGSSGSGSTSYVGNLRYKKTDANLQARIAHQRQYCDKNMILDDNSSIANSNSSNSVYSRHGLTNFLSDSTKSLKKILDTSGVSSITSTSSPNSPKSIKSNKANFWTKKGWKKIPGFSSTTKMNKIGINDETKLNSGASWDDSFNTNSASNLNNINNNNRININKTLESQSFCVSSNADIVGDKSITPRQIYQNAPGRGKLDYRPSTRTVSSEDSCYSEDRYISSDDDELDLDGNELDDEFNTSIQSNDQHENCLNSSLNSDKSSSSKSNYQLRSTLNKAKYHLSFDKWKSNSPNNSLNSNSSTGGGVGGGNNINNNNIPPTMPLSASSNQNSPAESFSRLSRWFSMRRGSVNQYDMRGNSEEHKENRRNSIDHVDSSHLLSSPQSGKSSVKMSKLMELEEDPLAFALEGFTISRPNLANDIHQERRHIAPALPPVPSGLSQQQLKRRLIVAAIVHSENSYVASLQRLVNEYKKPLEDSTPPILNQPKISTLFHRLPEILQLHTLFRIALADSVRSWDEEEKIGDVFVASFSKTIVLEVYSGFINNFSIAMDLAKMEAKRKSALADFFKVKQISSHDRLSFFGLMVKPVQRFPQFILFLQDLLKYTPQGHHDRMSLQLALTQLESLAEMLNERKREAEQYQAFKEMIGHISGTFNIRSLLSSSASSSNTADNTTNSRHRCLLHEDNVTQLEFNQSGFIVKSKKRRLLLLNDKIICVSVAPKQSHDFGATEKLTFKWMYPVQDVEIIDNNQSITLSRILTAGIKRGNSLKSNSSAGGDTTAQSSTNSSSSKANNSSGGSNDADNLCNEMSNLMHDYEVVSRINELVGTLKGSYKDINLDITKKILTSIQGSIQKKDEEISWVDSCCLQIVLKANKNGKDDTTLTFQTENPSVKKEWITELRLAQLALDPNNSPAWEISEHDQRPLTKMPLFVKSHPVYKSQHQTEVCCGCYYSPNINSSHIKPPSKKRSKNSNTLWICSNDKINSYMTILTHNNQQTDVFDEIAAFNLAETIVTCMEYVRGGALRVDDDVNNDLIWMGTNNHRLLIYSANYPINDEQMANVSLPGIPSQILNFIDCVYVALTNGSLVIYHKEGANIWNLNNYKMLALQTDPITSILPINNSIYFAAGKQVYVVNTRTNDIEKKFHIKHINNNNNITNNINLLAHSGIGLWISLKNSSIICLYHTETFKHLQDINIASNVLRVTSSHQSPKDLSTNSSIYVTALMAAKGLLWVGTNVGITLTIPLPRLEGVPIISGGVNISYHAHFGPVTFLLPLVTKSYHGNDNQHNQHRTIIQEDSCKDAMPMDVNKTSGENVDNIVVGNDKKSEMEMAAEFGELQKHKDALNLKEQICSSPLVLRKKKLSTQISIDATRLSKTLPRNLRSNSGTFSTSINSTISSSSQYSDQGCDVYGLYGDLIFVKEDFENHDDRRNILDTTYDYLRRSDPDIAAIPAKVSTLDRRLRMKVSRPRSLDLSNWSVESRSSSLYTSSGSDENIVSGKSVSRNNSSASHKMNNSDLVNINENEVADMNTMNKNSVESTITDSVKEKNVIPEKYTKSTSNSNNKKKKNQQSTETGSGGRRTILTLTGGRGYINWRHIWYNTPDGTKTSTSSPQQQNHQRSNSISVQPSRLPNSTDSHIIIWEKKL